MNNLSLKKQAKNFIRLLTSGGGKLYIFLGKVSSRVWKGAQHLEVPGKLTLKANAAASSPPPHPRTTEDKRTTDRGGHGWGVLGTLIPYWCEWETATFFES